MENLKGHIRSSLSVCIYIFIRFWFVYTTCTCTQNAPQEHQMKVFGCLSTGAELRSLTAYRSLYYYNNNYNFVRLMMLMVMRKRIKVQQKEIRKRRRWWWRKRRKRESWGDLFCVYMRARQISLGWPFINFLGHIIIIIVFVFTTGAVIELERGQPTKHKVSDLLCIL